MLTKTTTTTLGDTVMQNLREYVLDGNIKGAVIFALNLNGGNDGPEAKKHIARTIEEQLCYLATENPREALELLFEAREGLPEYSEELTEIFAGAMTGLKQQGR